MTRPKLHRCARCGIEMHEPNRACRDCRSVDPTTCKTLTRKKATA